MNSKWNSEIIRLEQNKFYSQVKGDNYYINCFKNEIGFVNILFCGLAFPEMETRTTYVIKVVEFPYEICKNDKSRKKGFIRLSKRKSKNPQFYIGNIPIYQKIIGSGVFTDVEGFV